MAVTLPDIFPQDNIEVSGEEHTFANETYEYTLDKAPIHEIVKVTDTANNEYREGTDYVLSNDATDIIWQQSGGDIPQDGERFLVTYSCDSILGRYIDSADEEMAVVDGSIEDVIQQKFIDQTDDDNLDKFGKLFGDVIGSRNGRSNQEYRTYLKSVIQSFVSRGTQTGIKLAVSAATDIPIEFVSIKEDFTTNTYEVVIEEETQLYIPLDILYQVAEIADPSGVLQSTTRYKFTEDATTTTDAITGLGIQIDTSGTVTDTNWDSSNWDQMTWDPSLGTSAQLVNDSVSENIRISNVSQDSWDVDSWDSASWDSTDVFEKAQMDDTIEVTID